MRGILRLAAAFVTYYRSRLSNPSKDCLTPSKTSTKCLLLALGRLCQAIPGLYRCKQHNLPPQSIMQILVAGYLHKCLLSLSGLMELLRQRSRLLGSQRIEGTSSGDRARSIDSQAPGKESQYHSSGELRESKTNLLGQMRHVFRLTHRRLSTDKASVH